MEEIDDIKIEKKHKIKILLISIIVFLMSVVGVSYAYFSLSIVGNEEASVIETDTAGLEITYVGGQEIVIEDIFSGASVVKTFTVSNTGTMPAYYDIKIADVFGTFVKDELVYTLSGTNGGGSVSQTIMPNNDGLLKAKISINAGVTQTFTLTVTFKETGSNQNYNQTASYKGKIQIISPYKNVASGTSNIKLVDRIFADNTAYAMNTTSKYVTGSSGIAFTRVGGIGYGGYYIDEEEVNFTSSGNRSLGATFSLDTNSGTFRLTGTAGTSKTYSTADIGKYTCYHTNSTYCYNAPQEVYKILEVSGSTVTRVARYVAKPYRSSWNGLGLYYTSTNTMDNLTTYFFRGPVTNNYVSFAGDLWRIVRINEDGTIRLIKQTNYANSAYNTTINNRMYVGYMFGTTSDPYTNSNPSTIKTKVEQYYDSKLASLSDYLAPIYFCNDRSTTSTSTTSVNFAAYVRLNTNKAPIFKCGTTQEAEDRDLFTMTTDTRGNKTLTKSIGLLTVDEFAYAGGLYTRISGTYLDNNATWYTVSPWTYTSSSYARIAVERPGGYTDYSNSNSSLGVRPVINLKADVLVSGGTGAANNPYVIVTN